MSHRIRDKAGLHCPYPSTLHFAFLAFDLPGRMATAAPRGYDGAPRSLRAVRPLREGLRRQGIPMKLHSTTVTRIDPAEPTKRPRTLDQFTDAEIQAADGLALIDPARPDWQELLWSAPIGDGKITSMTLMIVEIAVDSRSENEIEAARRRVRRIKAATKRLR